MFLFQLESRDEWHWEHNPQRLEENGIVIINLENCSVHRLMVVQLIDAGVIVAPNNRYKAAFQFLKNFDIACVYQNNTDSDSDTDTEPTIVKVTDSIYVVNFQNCVAIFAKLLHTIEHDDENCSGTVFE